MRGGGKHIDVENKFGYIGKYQFGEDALKDIGYYVGDSSKNRRQLPNGKSQFQYDWLGDWTGKNGATSKDAFLKSEATQDAAARDWVRYLCKTMKHFKLDKFIGETISGVEVTESGIIAAAHLKGFGSAKQPGVIQFLRSNGEVDAHDAFGTSVSKYMAKFKGYELGCCGALTVHLLDRDKQPIAGIKYEVRSQAKVVKKGLTDSKGRTHKVVGGGHSNLSIWIARLEGGFKAITSLLMPTTTADLILVSPKIKINAELNQHKGASGQYKRQVGDHKSAIDKTKDRNVNGHPVVVATSPHVAVEKSGVQWCTKFDKSSKTDDLKEPFRSYVNDFLLALNAGGVRVIINTTWRPPQRSYLMYYAREISDGNLAPKDVPPFIPQNGDESVNIDWAHIGANGESDLDAAKKSAREMDKKYDARQAIGKPYKSNHNGAEAIDMKFVPEWGIGKSVKNKAGDLIEIKSKRDLIDIGATYGVLHWNYAGEKNKVDNPHWSKTGN